MTIGGLDREWRLPFIQRIAVKLRRKYDCRLMEMSRSLARPMILEPACILFWQLSEPNHSESPTSGFAQCLAILAYRPRPVPEVLSPRPALVQLLLLPLTRSKRS